MRYKIGYTTGVFDLFHIGHLNILRRAKEQCDYLIVGVSTDELIRQTKGKQPIIPEDERKQIVAAIRYVDRVVDQVDMNKMNAYFEYKFDAVFVGDDWKGSERFTEFERQLEPYGAVVVYLPRTAGTSSTLITATLHGEV